MYIPHFLSLHVRIFWMEEKVKSWYSTQCTLQVYLVFSIFPLYWKHRNTHTQWSPLRASTFWHSISDPKKSSKIYKCQERLSLYHGGQIRLCMTTLWPPSGFWREEGRAPLHPTSQCNAYVLFRLTQTGNGGEGTELHNRQCLWLDRICKINKHLERNPFLCAADICLRSWPVDLLLR